MSGRDIAAPVYDWKGYGFDTRQVHAGEYPDLNSGLRVPPIALSAGYLFDDFDDQVSRFDGSIFSGSGSGGAGGGSGGNGLTYLLDVAGQNRFALRAFASDSRVSILSTPRIMVKSGNEASIDIGTEVPIISMQTTSNQQTEGTTNLLQSIQYRKTGIILSVTPTVYSDDRIDLDISQEVSEALPVSEDSSISSPSIFNRSLNTSLSLRDGGSVVMAGLMSNRVTNSDGGIPLLKDVPVLGSLFKNQSKQSNNFTTAH